MSERELDFERYLRDFGNGSIWLLKEEAIRLGAGYLPVHDDKTMTTKLRAPNDQAELNEVTLLGAINDARLTIERPDMFDRDGVCYVNATGFLGWLAQYIAQTQAQEIVFPNELASAVRKAKAKATVSLQPNAEEEFESLVLALEGWFDKKIKDLPRAKQQRVERDLILHLLWDQLTPEQRKGKAAQWDYKNDPTKERERQYLQSFLEHLDKLKAELAEVESKATLTFSEFEKKEAKVKALQQEIARMELQKQRERGDVIHEGVGLDAGEVSVNDFIAYPKAMNLLEDKWQATVEELAVWVFLGPEQGGLAAFTNANELNPPPRFFFCEYYDQMDYLSLLQGWWFRRSDIEQFVPVDRYITGTALIERWSTLPGKRPDAFIRAKIAESRLLDLHPTFGGTQGNFGEQFGGVSFPPLDSGLFSIKQIEAIEAEDGIELPKDYGSTFSHPPPESRTDLYVTLKSVVESTGKPYQDILCLARDNHERLKLMVLVNFRDLVQTVPPPGTTGKSGYFAVPWADINDLIKDDLIAVDRVVPIDGRRAGVGEMAVGLQRHDRDEIGAIRLIGEPERYELPKDAGKFYFSRDQAEEFFSLTEKQPATSHAAPLPEEEKGKQNSFIAKAGLCRIIFQGDELYPIKDSRPLREIAGRLAEPFEKWKSPIVSTNEPALDVKAKKAIKSHYQELRDRIVACKITEERQKFEDKLEKLATCIENNGGYITGDDKISWPDRGADNAKRTFQRNIQRGIDSIRKISQPFAVHLENHLRPEYCYRPPQEMNICWIVDLEPENNACAHDPLEKMTDEEKKVQTREFFGPNE